MSDCGICVYSEYEDESAEFVDVSWPKSRKEHRCEECHRTIAVGQVYQKVSGKWDGEFNCFTTCSVCAEIRAAFSCDGEVYGADFWESLTHNFGELNESCFDKLQTVEAKKYLRERWMKWKGLK